MAGLYADYCGTVEVAGFVYLGHKPGLNPLLTAEQNLHWYGAMCGFRGPIAATLERVGMAGYERVACRHMSAGQQRRVGLARLLVCSEPLWLLDEPLTALDALGRDLVVSLVESHLREGGGALCATHQGLEVPGSRALTLGA